MKTIDNYLDYIVAQINKLKETQANAIEQAAQLIADRLMKDHYLYVFGSGHSHMIAEELYARAGGLVQVKGILPPELMLHEFPTKSTFIERLDGYSENLLKHYPINDEDVLIIVSNSGRNNVIVEMALAAKNRNIPVIAITSMTHSSSVESRHSSGQRLMDIADIVIDTLTPPGDAGYYLEGVETPVGPLSNLMGIAIAETISVRVVEIAKEHNILLPVLRSSNLDGADERNNELFKKYLS